MTHNNLNDPLTLSQKGQLTLKDRMRLSRMLTINHHLGDLTLA
jgi:hypothetical protein